MIVAILESLQKDWPKRFGLTPPEVAIVLGRNSSSRGVLQRIRSKMKDGTYPNAVKIGGRWQLPLEELARVLSGHVGCSASGSASASAKEGVKRRGAIIGPKIRS